MFGLKVYMALWVSAYSYSPRPDLLQGGPAQLEYLCIGLGATPGESTYHERHTWVHPAQMGNHEW